MTAPRTGILRPLRLDRVAAVSIFVSIGIVLASVGALHLQRKHARDVANERVAQAARLAGESVERTLESVDRLVRITTSFRAGRPRPDDSTLARLAAAAPQLVDMILVTDASGAVVASSHSDVPVTSVAGLDFFPALRSSGGNDAVLGAAWLPGGKGKVLLPLARRFFSQQGEFAGVTVAALDAARLLEFAQSVDVGAGGLIGIVGDDGFLRAVSVPGQMALAPGADFRGHPGWAAMSATPAGAVTTPGRDGVAARLFAADRLKAWPIRVFVEMSPDEFEAHARSLDASIVVVGTLASGAVLALGWLLRRRLGELERAQHAILDRERRFRDFAETTADWFWEQDADLRYTFLSDTNFLIAGTKPDAQYGLRREESGLMGVDEPTMAAHRERLERRDAFRDFRYERFDAFGRRRYLSISGKPIFDEKGRFRGYRGSGRDMTEEMEARQALAIAKIRSEDSERTLRDGIEALRDAFLMFDASRRVLMWNRMYEEMFPHVSGHLEAGMLAYDLMSLHAASPLYEVPASKREGWIAERLSFVVRGGQPHDEELTDGRTIRLIGFATASGGEVHLFQDVTAEIAARRTLMQAKEAAEAASAAKSRFLATMSHEVRTPINGVMGMASLLLDSDLDGQQRLYVQSIRDASDSLLQIINDVLDFSKLEAGRLEFEDIVFDLRALVRSTVEIVAPRARAKGLALGWRIDGEMPERMRGDPGRLRQVLLNLLSNAIKFTERGGVDVAGAVEALADGHVRGRFSVRDTGIGIPADRLPRLFREFEQLDGSIARRFGGTGLGLAISRRLVGRMGGELRVESVPGEGSVFSFDVLLRPATAEAEGAVGATDWTAEFDRLARQRGRPLRVLLAEDNQTNRLIVAAMLEPVGLRVDTAGNGLEAVEAQRVAPYDLILMDVNMPEMDGYTATAAIRALDGIAARVPVVAVTANAFEADREAAISAGMDDFISKPFRKEALLALVAANIASAAAAGRAAE